MQRFFALVALFAFSIPVGMSIAGCGHNQNNYCIKNGHAYGITTSQVVYVVLQPQTTGLSLSWGQTGQLTTPTAFNCNGDSESVSKYTYASQNLQLADISPTGSVCGGTWNRNSQGGIADFTICTPPVGATTSGFAGCTAATCGVTQLTATGAAVTSNPVNVYVHPPITAINLSSSFEADGSGQPTCASQGTTVPTTLLSATTVQGPSGQPLPISDIGTIQYSAATGSVVNINNTQNPTNDNPVTGTAGTTPNGIATANLPGSTVINATVANVTSAAGYFYTCPPKTIVARINGNTSATVTTSSPQTITTTATDTNGVTLNGLSLDYASTEPQNLAVSSAGIVSTTFPSSATITAMCQPPTCNPAPIEKLGVLGNGTPVVGNNLTVSSAGRSSNLLWMSSPQSQYFSQVDLTTGANGTPIKMPYLPNSMVTDQGGNSLYFGSWRELMVYSAATNALSKQDPNVPGVVLAVSPDNSTLIINDQLRQVIYFYSVSSGAYVSTTGVATRAAFSPDGKNAYVVGPDHLYVHNVITGWSTYSIADQPSYSACTLNNNNVGTTGYDPFCGPALTLTVPSVAAFLSGTTTDAYGFCPDTSTDPVVYSPKSGTANAETNQLTATADGRHVLGASNGTLSDIGLGTQGGGGVNSDGTGVPIGACPSANTGLTVQNSVNATALSGISASEIDQVVASPDSSVAFITYSGASSSGILPAYKLSDTPNAAGTYSTIQLSGSPGAPIAGIFSPDGSIFFVSTSGDSLIHEVSPTGLTDTGTTINPKLIDANGNAVAPQFLAVKSRSTT